MQNQLYFPAFRQKALTFSYDDGVLQDKRLIELFVRYDLKATFNLNSGLLGRSSTHCGVDHSHFRPEEIKEVYRGYEIAGHSLTHPDLTAISLKEQIRELAEDKLALERLCGFDVHGFAYPGGKYNAQLMDLLARIGFQYARAVEETESFELPKQFMNWQGTCRHTNPRLFELAQRFLREDGLKLFYVWGHSYEFDIYQDWSRMEEFCRMISERPEIWYASNREVMDYIRAYRSLVFADGMVYNPSRTAVYLTIDDQKIKLGGRELRCFD